MVKRSSTMQPTNGDMTGRRAMPGSVAASTVLSATVLATEIAIRNTIPAVQDHPNIRMTTAPSAVTAAIWTTAPGWRPFAPRGDLSNESADPLRTSRESTPISANCVAIYLVRYVAWVNRPTRIPASK